MRIKILRDCSMKGREYKAGEIIDTPTQEEMELTSVKPSPWAAFIDENGNVVAPPKRVPTSLPKPSRATEPAKSKPDDKKGGGVDG